MICTCIYMKTYRCRYTRTQNFSMRGGAMAICAHIFGHICPGSRFLSLSHLRVSLFSCFYVASLTQQIHTHTRCSDWGLRTVAAVGRNRPPFARTMLCHGTLPFPLPPDLKTGVGGRGTYTRNWVVKKWPSKTSAERMRTDKQVHQVIQKHPHANIVRILDVSATEGVLMELFEEVRHSQHSTCYSRYSM